MIVEPPGAAATVKALTGPGDRSVVSKVRPLLCIAIGHGALLESIA